METKTCVKKQTRFASNMCGGQPTRSCCCFGCCLWKILLEAFSCKQFVVNSQGLHLMAVKAEHVFHKEGCRGGTDFLVPVPVGKSVGEFGRVF